MGTFDTPADVVAPDTRTTSGDSGPLMAHGDASFINLLVCVTAVSGTSPTLALSVEWSPDSGSAWCTAETPDEFATITTTTNVCKRFAAKSNIYRIRWTLGGTDPSFQFFIHEYLTTA